MSKRNAAPTLRRLVEGFTLTIAAEGKSPKTISFYEGNLTRFLWYARSHGFPENVHQLTPEHIREFLVYVRDAEHRWGLNGNGSESSAGKASYTTLWHYYVSLRRLFRWAQDEGFISNSPMANIKLLRPQKKVIEPYTKEALKALIRVCQHDINNGSPFLGTRNKAIILVFLDSGIRLSELANIRLEDMDLGSGVIRVTGKGSKQRLVAIAKTTRVALWKYKTWRPDGSPWLWLGEEGQRLTARAIQSMFKRLKDRAGLRDTGGLVHKMRHTMAMTFLEGDGDIRSLQVLLGHSDIEMTMRYLQAVGTSAELVVPEFRKFLSKYGIDKPIWVTEARVYVTKYASLEEHGQIFVKGYVVSFAFGVDKFFYSCFRPSPFDSPEQKNAALIDESGERRPAYYGLKTLIEKLDKFTSAEKLAEGQYKFMVEGEAIYVLWGSGKIPTEIAGEVLVTDIYGEETRTDSSAIKLTESPIFVE